MMLMGMDSKKDRVQMLLGKLVGKSKPMEKPKDDMYNDAMEMLFADFVKAIQANNVNEAFVAFKQVHRTLHIQHEMRKEKEEIKDEYADL